MEYAKIPTHPKSITRATQRDWLTRVAAAHGVGADFGVLGGVSSGISSSTKTSGGSLPKVMRGFSAAMDAGDRVASFFGILAMGLAPVDACFPSSPPGVSPLFLLKTGLLT